MDKAILILRYTILALILWALPSFLLVYSGSLLGTVTSYGSLGLMVLYLLVDNNRGRILGPFIVLGLMYYVIGGLNYTGNEERELFVELIKYLIVILCGAQIIRKTTFDELFVFLMIGSLSIIVSAIFFPDLSPNPGRFSGFYLNPNVGGAISLMGFALSFGIKNKKLKYLGQLIFSVGGFFTLSRYFMGIWVVINLLSVFVSRKNLVVPAIGVVALTLIFTFADKLPLRADRFLAIQSLVSGGNPSQTAALSEDSRTETWASYKNIIMDKPILGNGYKKMQGRHFGLWAGVHNTYLLVWGEAGIIPFLLIVGMYLFIAVKGYQCFKTEPHHTMLALVLVTALLVTHNYFDKFSLLFMSMYIWIVFTERQKAIPQQPNYSNHGKPNN